MQIEYSKAGSLANQSGDIGPICISKGASEQGFRDITKGLSLKIEQIKSRLRIASNGTSPVLISFAEDDLLRSAYIMFSDFSKFPNENRNYDRTEYYVGKNELTSWLDYFINKYKTEPVQEKNYEENPITINEVTKSSKSIDSIVTAFANGSEIIKLSQNDSVEILGSLPSIYHQYISFAINTNEQICKQLGIQISIEGNSNNFSTSNNLDLNNETLLNFLEEYVKFKPCNSLSELAILHINLANEFKNIEFNLNNKPILLELFKKTSDIELKEGLLQKLINLKSFGSNFSKLSHYYIDNENSNTIKKILSDFEVHFEAELVKFSSKENKYNNTTILKNKLITELGYTEKSPEFIKSIYQKQVLNIAISIVNQEIGVNNKHLADILKILKKSNSNLLDENLLNETITGLEKLEVLKVKSSPPKKKNNQLSIGTSSNLNIIDEFASTLINHKPLNEIFHLFLYLFSVPTTLKLLNYISNENIIKYKNEILNWLNTNDTNLQTYNSDYKSLKANKNYAFYFKSDERIQEEADRKNRKNQKLILKLEQNIQSCDNKFIIQKLKSEDYECVLDFLNKPENIEKLRQNKNIKYNVELGCAFEKYFVNYQPKTTSLFYFIDNKYPNKKNRFINTMKNFKNFSTANKIVMIIGVLFFILGIGALLSKLNLRSPINNTPDIEFPIEDSIVYSSKQIENTNFTFVKADQTINLKTFCADTSINNLLKNNYSNLKINDSTNAQIFFSFKNPNKFMLFFKDLNSKYLHNYLEFEKATSWKVKLAEGKPSIYSGHDYVNDMKTISVIMEP